MRPQLYPTDLLYIRDRGVPLERAREYVDFFLAHRVKLTRRGRAFYRAACILHGLDPSCVETIMSRDRFDDIAVKITAMRTAAQFEIDFCGFRGDMARRVIDSLRRLTPAQMQERIDHYERCAAAGPAVVIVNFLTRQRLRVAAVAE